MVRIRFRMAKPPRAPAPTTDAEWDLYRTFESVVRCGSLTAAARALGTSQSTVSRHLARLESLAGSPLLLRETPVRPTERGESLLHAIAPMVDGALAARAALENAVDLQGEVVLTTVGEVARWMLAPKLGSFCRAYPRIRLTILAGNERKSLAAGEADLALRMARPEEGELVGRRLGQETFGYFVHRDVPLSADTPWLALSGSLKLVAEQRHAARAFASREPRLAVEDVEALGMLVQAGLGVAVLPRGFASRLEGVVETSPGRVGAKELEPIPPRALWLVVHRRKQKIPKIRAVMDWIVDVWEATERQRTLRVSSARASTG